MAKDGYGVIGSWGELHDDPCPKLSRVHRVSIRIQHRNPQPFSDRAQHWFCCRNNGLILQHNDGPRLIFSNNVIIMGGLSRDLLIVKRAG